MKKQILCLILVFLVFSGYSQHWTFLGFPDEKIQAIAVHPANPDIIFASSGQGYLYKSSDGGIIWDTVAFDPFNSIVFHPDDPDTMYATLGNGSFSDGIYKSVDGGNNWSVIEWLYLSTSITIPGYPSGTLVAGTRGTGVYESNDYGSTWTQINDSLDNLNVLSLIHINPCDCDSGQVYFAGTEGGIFYYDYDTGGPWQNTNTATNATVPAFSFDGDGTGVSLWAAIDGGSWSDGMYKSTDYGTTWNVSEYWPWIIDILVDPVNSFTVYAADSVNGVKKTTNEGLNWQTINDGLGDSTVYCLAQSPADTIHLYAGTEHGLYVLNLSTGFSETLNENSITVYPNPVNDKIVIESSKKANIEIINSQGQIIENLKTSNTKTTVDLTRYSYGVYIIKIKTDKSITTKKIIKQ
jgi:hypothetical protein